MRESLLKIIYKSFNGIMNFADKSDVEDMFKKITLDEYFVLENSCFKKLGQNEMSEFLKTDEAKNIINHVENVIKKFDVYCCVVEIYSLRMAEIDLKVITKYILKKYKNLVEVVNYEIQ